MLINFDLRWSCDDVPTWQVSSNTHQFIWSIQFCYKLTGRVYGRCLDNKSCHFLSKKYLSFPDCFSDPWIVQVALNCQLDILEWLIWRLFVRRLNPIRIPTCSPLGPDATVCTFVVFGNWLLSARGPRLCPKRGWETQTKLPMYVHTKYDSTERMQWIFWRCIE
jgi:hypothetical protein